MLMEQAEALLQWGELEQADKLAALAVEQRVAYSPFDSKPEDLLKRIAALRQQNNPAGPRQIDNRDAGPNAVGPSLAGRQQAVELMRQIRGALDAGQIGQAESLCRRLDALRIPENAFAPGEDRPGLVFQDVQQAMARNVSGVVQAGGVSEAERGGPIGRLRSFARSHPQRADCRSASGDDPVAAQRAGRTAGRRRCGAAVAGLQSVPTGRKRP